MEAMDVLASLGTAGISIFMIILALLFILLPFSAYSAQKWANKNYRETVKTNQKLDEIITLLNKTK